MCNCERYHVTMLLAGLAERPERQPIISGLRQTGKTTHVRQALNNIDTDERYLAVDEPPQSVPPLTLSSLALVAAVTDERDGKWLAHVWEQGRMDADRSERGFVLVLDEIQKVPNCSEVVKGL